MTHHEPRPGLRAIQAVHIISKSIDDPSVLNPGIDPIESSCGGKYFGLRFADADTVVDIALTRDFATELSKKLADLIGATSGAGQEVAPRQGLALVR